MTTHIITAEDNAAFEEGRLAKAQMRECRLGHCGHAECERAADERFAAHQGDDEIVELEAVTDEQGGEETDGAMLKDYLRDCRLGHCNHADCRRQADRRVRNARRSRRDDGRSPFPFVVLFQPDGRFDKTGMREARFFGTRN